jgi:hypothetical protein
LAWEFSELAEHLRKLSEDFAVPDQDAFGRVLECDRLALHQSEALQARLTPSAGSGSVEQNIGGAASCGGGLRTAAKHLLSGLYLRRCKQLVYPFQ